MNLTTSIRERVRKWMPLEDLLPDRLPAFVRSPAYFFGVITLSSLVLLIITGMILSAFGPQWWHDSGVGRFVNGIHFWSSQAFFFALTLHLWTEFFKGSWRHGRRWTWVTGALLFVGGIGTAFTGYLSQTNFDAQWIAVSAKDALNGVMIGAFFNVMNFGQMYGFHVIILPLFLALLVAVHLVQVRIRGVVRPYALDIATERAREERWGGKLGRGWSSWFSGRRQAKKAAGVTTQEQALASDQVRYYAGIRMMPYDLIREGLLALALVAVVSVVLAAVLSSPDDPPVTIQQYAQEKPVDFVTTATAEISGTSILAQYGPPYNDGTDSVQYVGPLSLQRIGGITHPINTAQTYVLEPLTIAAQSDPVLATDLKTFAGAGADQQTKWEDAYVTALGTATEDKGQLVVPAGDYGPYGTMMNRLLGMATSGALDGILLRSKGFYQNDFTRPLLFLAEGALPDKAEAANLLGSQWGMMNETHNYPGQSWLWLYTMWYQVPPFSTTAAANADVLVWALMAGLTLLLVIFPFIPFLNRLPFRLGVHRLIWRDYYRDVRGTTTKDPTTGAAAGDMVAGASDATTSAKSVLPPATIDPAAESTG
ncbi:MAG: cytochrome b N-terminal domain-containing protein [Chloroflexota bacterium]|nr:cytochrome b N-terminal domain-containing protein [Chloroflexota bacterium]